MKRLLLGSILSAGVVSTAFAQSPQSVDETQIRERLSAYAEARQGGDGETQAAFYSDDADAWFSVTRKMANGKAEIAKDLHVPTGPGRPFRLDIETVRFVAPDIAAVDGQYFSTSAEPGGHVFYLMVKQKSSWKIRAARITRYPTTPRS
jgi:ketosteroid isomerase-like protein